MKHRVAELTEFYTKVFSIISAISAIGLSKKGLVQDIWISRSQRYFLPSERKSVFALGFVPEIINSENFMVSCFSLIYRTV